MRKIFGLISFAALLCILNVIPFWLILQTYTTLSWGMRLLCVLAAIILRIALSAICGDAKNYSDRRLRWIAAGCEKLRTLGWAALLEIPVIALSFTGLDLNIPLGIFTVLVPVLGIALMLISGMLKTALGAKQIKLTNHILLLCLWWMPIVNIILIRKAYRTARRELFVESARLELENTREENQICRTKYPILLVHGIFFRDWQLLNYWGRVPASLKRNGAQFYYGGQQSATTVAKSAEELRGRIEEVLAQTGAEKVNIIAHSKGGLDSRYAISCLGMDEHVATLTTINTPHLGCDMVDMLLEKLPQGFVRFITNRYNGIFRKLGDHDPDFLAGVKDLSAKRCAVLNEEMPDSPNVSYRSYMTVMSSARSAGFPLNFSYLLIKKLNGANDGLVWEGSAVHGEHRLLKIGKRRGISHGDVIDLMRENIEDYDVREMYVDIVSRLREEGY